MKSNVAKETNKKTKNQELVNYCMKRLENVPFEFFIVNACRNENVNEYSTNVFYDIKQDIVFNGYTTGNPTPHSYEKDFIDAYEKIILKIGLENEIELKKSIIEYLLECFINGIYHTAFKHNIKKTEGIVLGLLKQEECCDRSICYGNKIYRQVEKYYENMEKYILQNFNIYYINNKKYFSFFDDFHLIHPDIDLYYFCKSLKTTIDGTFYDYHFEEYMYKYIYSFISNYRFIYRVDVFKKKEKEEKEMREAIEKLNSLI